MSFIRRGFRLIWIILTIILLLFAFQWSKDVGKCLIISFSNDKCLEIIRNKFYEIKPVLNNIWYVVSIILVLEDRYKSLYKKYKVKKFEKNIENRDDLDKALYNYINSKDQSCFLLYGNWGIGKSYRIQEYMKEIKEINYRNIYRISCFGISSREALLNEIQNVCEEEDKDVFKLIIDILHNIPVIGELLYSLLKKDYILSGIKEGSIFIFDDFERIAPSDLSEIEKIKYQKSIAYGYELGGSIDEASKSAISDEIDNIEKSINRLETRDYCQSELYVFDKFNLVTSLINEMQEHFKMKVIIIANKDKIPNGFFNDVFESKLACRKFKMKTVDNIFDDLALKQLKSFLSITKEEKEFISELFIENSTAIKNLWREAYIENARVLNNIICAFISCVEKYDLFGDKKLGENLLYSIILSHISIEKNVSKLVMNMETGENPLLFFKKYYYAHDTNSYMKNNIHYVLNILQYCRNISSLRWCGTQLSFEWLSGIYEEVDKKYIINTIKEYDNTFAEKYISTEEEAIPVKFEDAMLYIAKGNIEHVNKVKKLFRENKIDIKNFTAKFITENFTHEKYSSAESMLLWMDRFNINELYRSDYELKETIFEILQKQSDTIDEEKTKVKYSSNYINYKEWMDMSIPE